ncbi:MAG: preprotein translocase subunit YajC [Dehalococcoidia bacterium]
MEFVLLPLGLVLLFYFILLKPVLNQQKKHRRDISSLEVGDEVLTAGGFYATVREINTRENEPSEIVLEVAPGVRLRGTPGAIDSIMPRRSEGRSEAEPGRADEHVDAPADPHVDAPADEHTAREGRA